MSVLDKQVENTIARAVAEARADEARKCAADVCRFCKDADELQRLADGTWMHVYSAELSGKKIEQKIPCRASAIHERLHR